MDLNCIIHKQLYFHTKNTKKHLYQSPKMNNFSELKIFYYPYFLEPNDQNIINIVIEHMNFFKGLLGIKNDLDSMLNKSTFQGTLYKVVNNGRNVIFKQSKITIIHGNQEDKYFIRFVEELTNEIFEFPIYAEMSPVTFMMNRDQQQYACFQWILDQSKDRIGCFIKPQNKQTFKYLFCKILHILTNGGNIQQYLTLCEEITGIPTYQSPNSVVKNNQQKEQTKLSVIQQQSQHSSISQILANQSLVTENILVQSGILYQMHEFTKKLIRDPIVFILRGNQNFEYEWIVQDNLGNIIIKQAISEYINYDINLSQGSMRWFYPQVQGTGKVYEIAFGNNEIAANVKFAIGEACFQMKTKKKIKDTLCQQQYEYMKKINQQNQVNNFHKAESIIKVYQKNQQQINIENDQEEVQYYANEDVKEGIRKYRTFCQGKIQDFQLVSLGESLELIKISENNKIKIQGNIKLLDGKGQEFVADKILLHDNDTKTVIKSQKGQIFYQDIQTGKIIQQWQPSHKKINYICYENKKQNNQLFRAINNNTIYELDPRIPEGVAMKKSYTTNPNFCQIQSVRSNRIITGSEDGVIRLYNQVGINANCKFTSFGQSIRHLQSTKDGNFVLATLKTKLILLPTLTENDISLFEHKVKIAQRPSPVELKIKAQHLKMCKISQYQLTPAKFDQSSVSSQKFIVSGFGQYLAIWNLSDVIYNNNLSYKFIKIGGVALQADFKYNDIKKLMAMTNNGFEIIQTRYNKKQIKQE